MWEQLAEDVALDAAKMVTSGALGAIRDVATRALSARRRQSDLDALFADRDGLAHALAERADEDPELAQAIRTALAEHHSAPRWSSPIYSILRAPFVDRDDERAAVHGPGVHLVSGQRGMGKTGFVCRLGSELAEEFPDGQVYIDLENYQPDNVRRRAEVSADVLRQLGVDREWLAESTVDAAEQYREVTGERTFLLILDNAQSLADVDFFLPASPRSLTLVTTIRPDDGMLANYPSEIRLGGLDSGAALALLDGVAGAGTVAAEPPAAAELVERCDGMPLLIRLAAARVRRRSGSGSATPVASVLRTYERAGVLGEHDSEDAVHRAAAAIDTELAELSPQARALCGRWAVAPVAELSEPALAALAGEPTAGIDAAGIDDVLDELRDAGLVVAFGARRHKLLRTVAERARVHCPANDTANARLLRSYADAALLLDSGDRLRRYEPPARAPEFDFAGVPPLEFVDAERFTYLGLVRYAGRRGDDVEVGRLCGALEVLMLRRGHHRMFLELNAVGIAAAERLGRRALLARLHNQQGRAYTLLHEFGPAYTALRRAQEALAGLGDTELESSVLETLGRWYEEQEQFGPAAECFEQAVRRDRALGADARRALGIHLRMLANARVGAGDPYGAKTLLDEAWQYLADDRNRARGLLVYAKAAYRAGYLPDATGHIEGAEVLLGGDGSDQYAVELAELAGDIASARAQREPAARERFTDLAAAHWRRAWEPLHRAGHPKARRFIERLAAIGRAP